MFDYVFGLINTLKMERNATILKFGFYVSVLLAILTVATFALAMLAVPASGPYCPGNCMEYPYSNLLNYYPRDYYWMYLAVIQLFILLLFVVSLHYQVTGQYKLFSAVGVVFTLLAGIILLADYYIQFAVIPISLMKGETDGVALLTQYNGHGVFIALEELGYWAMSIAFFFIAAVFSASDRLNKSIKWTLRLPLSLNLIAFVGYLAKYGINRDYRFEVAAISIDWLCLIVISCLVSVYFKRRMANSY